MEKHLMTQNTARLATIWRNHLQANDKRCNWNIRAKSLCIWIRYSTSMWNANLVANKSFSIVEYHTLRSRLSDSYMMLPY